MTSPCRERLPGPWNSHSPAARHLPSCESRERSRQTRRADRLLPFCVLEQQPPPVASATRLPLRRSAPLLFEPAPLPAPRTRARLLPAVSCKWDANAASVTPEPHSGQRPSSRPTRFPCSNNSPRDRTCGRRSSSWPASVSASCRARCSRPRVSVACSRTSLSSRPLASYASVSIVARRLSISCRRGIHRNNVETWLRRLAIRRRASRIRESVSLSSTIPSVAARSLRAASESGSALNSERDSLICATSRFTSARAASYAFCSLLTRWSITCFVLSRRFSISGSCVDPRVSRTSEKRDLSSASTLSSVICSSLTIVEPQSLASNEPSGPARLRNGHATRIHQTACVALLDRARENPLLQGGDSPRYRFRRPDRIRVARTARRVHRRPATRYSCRGLLDSRKSAPVLRSALSGRTRWRQGVCSCRFRFAR